MDISDMELGKVYKLKGKGELLLVRFVDKTPVFAAHGSETGTYYASPDEVFAKATKEDIDARYAQGKSRGVACDDSDCWCKRVKSTVRNS